MTRGSVQSRAAGKHPRFLTSWTCPWASKKNSLHTDVPEHALSARAAPGPQPALPCEGVRREQ